MEFTDIKSGKNWKYQIWCWLSQIQNLTVKINKNNLIILIRR